jgi:hypothetical protein
MIDGDDFSLMIDERFGQLVDGNHRCRLSQTTSSLPTLVTAECDLFACLRSLTFGFTFLSQFF